MNALTGNIHLLFNFIYQPTKTKNKIIIEKDAFPSDHYAVQVKLNYMGFDPKNTIIELLPRAGEKNLTSAGILLHQ